MSENSKLDLTDIANHLRFLHLVLIIICALMFGFSLLFGNNEADTTLAEYAELKKFLSNKGAIAPNANTKLCQAAMKAYQANNSVPRATQHKGKLKLSFKDGDVEHTHVFSPEHLQKVINQNIVCRFYTPPKQADSRFKSRIFITNGAYHRSQGINVGLIKRSRILAARGDIAGLKEMWNGHYIGRGIELLDLNIDLNNAFVVDNSVSRSLPPKISSKSIVLTETNEGAQFTNNIMLLPKNYFYYLEQVLGKDKLRDKSNRQLSHFVSVTFNGSLSKFVVIIPVYSKSYKPDMKKLFTNAFGMDFSKLKFTKFEQTFPGVNKIIASHNLKLTRQLAKHINALEKEVSNYFELGGIKIFLDDVLKLSVVIVIILLIYFWVFLRALTYQFDPRTCVIGTAWIGILPEKTAFALSLLTLVCLPIAAVVYHVYRNIDIAAPFSNLYILVEFAVLLLVALLVLLALIKLHKKCKHYNAISNVEENIKKSALHVRSLHFIIVLVSIVLAAGLFNLKRSNIEQLKNEFSAFTQLVDQKKLLSWSDEVYKIASDKIIKDKRLSKNQKFEAVTLTIQSERHNLNYTLSIKRQFRGSVYGKVFSRFYFNNETPGNSYTKVRNVRLDLNKLDTISRFWDVFQNGKFVTHQIVKLDYQKAVLVNRHSLSKRGNVQMLDKSPKVSKDKYKGPDQGYNVGTYFIPAADYPSLVKLLDQQDNLSHFLIYFAEGHETYYKVAVVIPVYTKIYQHDTKKLLSAYFGIDFNTIMFSTFKESFPEINRIVSKNNITDVKSLFAKVNESLKEIEDVNQVNVFGAKLQIDNLINIGSIILIVLMAYGWVIVRSLVRSLEQSTATFTFAWVGMLPYKTALIATLATCVLLPMAVCVMQLSQIIKSDNLNYQINTGVTVIALIIVSALLMVSLINLNKLNRRNRLRQL